MYYVLFALMKMAYSTIESMDQNKTLLIRNICDADAVICILLFLHGA